MLQRLFTPYSEFIGKYFDHKVQKIPVDIGCSCPVRDGRISTGGCAFCNGRSFVPRFADERENLLCQIKEGIQFFERKTKGNTTDYLVYFQSGTNTYMPIQKANQMVNVCISLPEVKGFVFSTRPDCLSDEWFIFLKKLSAKTFVEVEIGVETVNDDVLKSVGRGHNFTCSASAISHLHALGIPVCAHLILGLPGETKLSMLEQATQMNRLKVESVKLHQLQILKGAKMETLYKKCPTDFSLFTLDEYVDFVITFLTHLSPQIAIERFVSQSPSSELIAPKWGVKNDVVLNLIKKTMQRKGVVQGSAL